MDGLKLLIILLITICGVNSVYAFDLPWSQAAKANRLSKKQQTSEAMVQTKQEWLERATDVNMEHRNVDPYKKEKSKKITQTADFPVFFEKYNTAPGSKGVDLSEIKRTKNVRSTGVVSPDFKFMGYSESFFFPSNNQVSSGFYIIELDTSKGKKKRVEDASVFGGAKKTELISSTNDKGLMQNLFSSLTIVDWSSNSKKILLKEQVGSTFNGLYQTYVWVYYMPNGELEGYAKKFDALNETIANFYLYRDNIILNRHRWDIKPLGFSAENNNVVLIQAHTYNLKKEPVFLGLWSIDTTTGQIKFVSENPIITSISTNGLMLVKKLP